MKATLKFKNDEIKTGDEWYEEGFAPTTFEVVGMDTTSAKITPEQALALSQNAYLPIKTQFKNAAMLLQYDHIIRKHGVEMESKFDGQDAVTGEAFSAGTKIIFFGGSRNAGKGAVIA